ncbi:MAG: VOC family protein [Geminicoccaceae bacterium]
MEQRLSVITLGVQDLARATAFFEALGWRAASKSDAIVFFQLGGLILGLFAREELARDAGVAADGSGFAGITLAYNTRSRDEVDALLAEAEAAGARVVKPAQDAVWGGYSGYFSDPDGHLFEICWNPFFPIDADGRVHIPAEPA